MEKRYDSLDKLIDGALSVYATSEPPSGMQERILTNIARRKVKSKRTMRIAAAALTAILFGTLVHRPIDSARTETVDVRPIVANIVEPKPPPAAEIGKSAVEVAPAAEAAEILIEEDSFITDLENDEEEGLLSDIELEPLTIAAVDLPALPR